MKSFFSQFLDPDVKVLLPDGTTRRLFDFLLPSALLMIAAVILMISMQTPYWVMNLKAPQYPKGLSVEVFVDHLEGDEREIDSLNHYLGMPALSEGGKFERSISIIGIIALGFLLMAAVFVHNQWAALFTLPILTFPIVFLADLGYILYQFGHSIDPKSALGGAIQPFTPPIFGEGKIGQFSTVALPGVGLILALIAIAFVLAGLWYHRAAYKPLIEARKRIAQAK